MGDGAGAIGAVLETSPLEREAKLLLANVLSDCYGDTRTALELYRECTDEDESDEVALWLHGVAASSQGAHDEAATCFERAAQLPAGEDDVDIALQLVIAAERAGKPAAELDALVDRLDPHVRRCWEYVAQVITC